MKRLLRSGALAGAVATIALSGRVSAQENRSDALRVLQTGTHMRVKTDTATMIGDLAQPFRPSDGTPVVLVPCPGCRVVSYPLHSITRLEMWTGSSRRDHIGVGLVIGAGVGGAAGAVEGGNAKIENSSLGRPGVIAGGAVGAAVGAVVGAVAGAVMPVHYHWETVPLPRWQNGPSR